MTRLWFRAKHYGWGWYPVTWEGWLVTLGFIGLLILNSLWFVQHALVVPFMIIAVVLVILLLWICYRTGEKPRWRWG